MSTSERSQTQVPAGALPFYFDHRAKTRVLFILDSRTLLISIKEKSSGVENGVLFGRFNRSYTHIVVKANYRTEFTSHTNV